jgi:cold shock CspA family protein
MTETATPRYLGMVKWFNKKHGYGFISVLNGESKGKDIFVHYSSVRTKDATEYKYLVQGEYVEFNIEKALKENHEYHAIDITGLYEGPILCDTRQISLNSRPAPAHNTSESLDDDIEQGFKKVKSKSTYKKRA